MRRTFAAALLLFGLTAAGAGAQSAPTFISLGPAEAALYKPDSGPAAHVALVVIHRTADFMRHPACTELAQRGFMMLCVNTRFTNNEGLVRFEDKLHHALQNRDIAAATNLAIFAGNPC